MTKINKNYLPDLAEDEYFLKVHTHKSPKETYNLGFIAKYNKDRSLPKAFEYWQPNYKETVETMYLHTETFRIGWELVDYRVGMSQSWVVVLTPENFRLEIYMSNFFELVLTNNTFVNGKLQGKFKWKDKKLVKEL